MNPFSERCSGILLHPTSLPGPHGVGDLGAQARLFVDFLVRAELSVALADALAGRPARRWRIAVRQPVGLCRQPAAVELGGARRARAARAQ